MKLDNHIAKLREHMAALEWGIKQNNQSALGFHASAGSVELLSVLLHKLKIVPADFQLNHLWFKSRKLIESRLGFQFPEKENIISLMESIEESRNPLCYGSPKTENIINSITSDFYKLKDIIERLLGEELD